MLFRSDLETGIQDEIAACENTQNWTGGKAIRTRWVDELKGLDETLEALTRATQLKDEAYIYANCRTFDIYADPRYVTYDLITKKLDRW